MNNVDNMDMGNMNNMPMEKSQERPTPVIVDVPPKNTDKEYNAGFGRIMAKWFPLSTHFDSDMGLGAKITLTY